jgi:hypothetical protein
MPCANKSDSHENSSVGASRRRRKIDSPVCNILENGLFCQRAAASTSLGSKPVAANPSGVVRPYSRSGDCVGSPQRNSRPSWTGCSVSISTTVRSSGNPAATQRSQKPVTMSSSDVPARPVCVSQADNSAKKASFMAQLYSAKISAASRELFVALFERSRHQNDLNRRAARTIPVAEKTKPQPHRKTTNTVRNSGWAVRTGKFIVCKPA